MRKRLIVILLIPLIVIVCAACDGQSVPPAADSVDESFAALVLPDASALSDAGGAPIVCVSFVDAANGYGVGSPDNPGAILRTSDGGKTWDSLPDFPNQTLTPEVLSFVSEKTGFLLCSNGPEYNGMAALYATNDGGLTWAKTGDLASSLSLYGFPSYFRMFDADHGIYCCHNGGSMDYLDTEDGGKTWDLAFGDSQGQGPPSVCAFDGADSGVIFYNGESVALYSGGKVGAMTDDGLFGLLDSNLGHCAAAAMRGDTVAAFIYETSGAGSYKFTMIVSGDGGQTWDSVSLPASVTETLENKFENNENVSVCVDFPDQSDGFLMISAFSSLLYTTDGGGSWSWR